MFYHIIFYCRLSEASLLSNDRQKGDGTGWEGGRKGLGVEGRKIINYILYEKKSTENLSLLWGGGLFVMI